MQNRSTQKTVTPDCYQKGEARLNQWLNEIHNNGLATESEKQEVERKYNQLFINKFRTDGKGREC